jgi:hypothetical protein
VRDDLYAGIARIDGRVSGANAYADVEDVHTSRSRLDGNDAPRMLSTCAARYRAVCARKRQVSCRRRRAVIITRKLFEA